MWKKCQPGQWPPCVRSCLGSAVWFSLPLGYRTFNKPQCLGKQIFWMAAYLGQSNKHSENHLPQGLYEVGSCWLEVVGRYWRVWACRETVPSLACLCIPVPLVGTKHLPMGHLSVGRRGLGWGSERSCHHVYYQLKGALQRSPAGTATGMVPSLLFLRQYWKTHGKNKACLGDWGKKHIIFFSWEE